VGNSATALIHRKGGGGYDVSDTLPIVKKLNGSYIYAIK
jgi:hypothetical protein